MYSWRPAGRLRRADGLSGFGLADGRNAGGFRDGFLHDLWITPAKCWPRPRAEALDELPGAPGPNSFPSLVETLNIAAAVDAHRFRDRRHDPGAVSPRAAWRCGRALIPVFRRLMDGIRAIPEIVIALVLIFVLGGGPVPAMIAIAIHTAGALGKLFSEVNENTDR
jgi:phosphonate transport system permease protein